MAQQRLLIVGASGRTGRALVHQALKAGHGVTALVRNPTRIGMVSDRLRVRVGDVFALEDVERAAKDHDAVLSALGAPPASRVPVRAKGTQVVVDGMRAAGVSRLISLSSFGVGESRSALPPVIKYLLVPLLLKRAFQDHEAQERCVRASSLRWTLVRPSNLTDGPQTGTYAHGTTLDSAGLSMKISRADVAEFMLKQLEDETYLRQAPLLSC